MSSPPESHPWFLLGLPCASVGPNHSWSRCCHSLLLIWASQVALVVNNPPANAGDIRDTGLIPGLERSPGEGHGNPLQFSCLKNPNGRGAWWAMVHRVTKSQIWLKQLSTIHSTAHYWYNPIFNDLPSLLDYKVCERSTPAIVIHCSICSI